MYFWVGWGLEGVIGLRKREREGIRHREKYRVYSFLIYDIQHIAYNIEYLVEYVWSYW